MKTLIEVVNEIKEEQGITKSEIAKRIGYKGTSQFFTAIKKNRMHPDREYELLSKFGYDRDYLTKEYFKKTK